MAISKETKQYWLSPNGLARIRYAKMTNGLSDKQIAEDIIGIGYTTLRDWRKDNPLLSAALKSTRDAEIAKAYEQLDRAAQGGEITGKITTKYVYKYDEDGNETLVSKEIHSTTEKAAPNVTAAIFKLKNLDADKWRDKIEHDSNVTVNGGIKVELSNDDIDRRIKELKDRLNE